ncbi:MAG: serine hydrolase domain-containing protein [Chitinophagaceae bacterium]
MIVDFSLHQTKKAMKSTYVFLCILFFLQLAEVRSQTKTSNKYSKTYFSNKTPAQRVDSLITAHKIQNGPGIAVSVIKDGAIVYKKGFGIANLEYGIPITTSTVFQVGSVSKQFTTFSILLLEQEGKLSIDDDIRKYLPEMVDYGYKITLRNLANHTSGIRDNTDLAYLIGTSEADLFSNEQAVKLITSQKGLNFIPGDEFEYCNSGFILLAEIVKRVSGQSFAEFTKTRIFDPLKMKNSQFIDDPEIIVKNRAYSYYKPNSNYYKSILNHSFVGSTGLNTTAEDLSLWAINFEKKTIGNDAIFNKMKEKSKLNNGEIIPYALGQENKVYKGLNVIFHGGAVARYVSYLLRIPEHNFSIVYTCNSHTFRPLDFVYNIIDCYLKDKETTTETKPVLNQSLLQNFVGYYEPFPGLIVNISKENDTLFLQAKGDNNRVKLQQISDYEFIYPNEPHSKIVFAKTNGQATNFLEWHFSDFSYKGLSVELKEFDETKINFAELIGRYYNSELKTSYNFVVKENKLVATHNINEDIILTALQPDVFISIYIGYFGKIEVIRNEQQQVIGCYISGQKTRRIKFEKIDGK